MPDLDDEEQRDGTSARTTSTTRRRCAAQQAVLRTARAATTRAHYKQLAAETLSGRSTSVPCAFPGLISALTMPSGGTSDYAPEMIHAAANGDPYACFVRPDTRIPFMAMPDGVEALIRLAAAPRERLTRTAYNVAAFNPSAEEIRAIVAAAFPEREADVRHRRQAPGHRRLLAGRRRRFGRAPRLGVLAHATTCRARSANTSSRPSGGATSERRRPAAVDDRDRDQHARRARGVEAGHQGDAGARRRRCADSGGSLRRQPAGPDAAAREISAAAWRA